VDFGGQTDNTRQLFLSQLRRGFLIATQRVAILRKVWKEEFKADTVSSDIHRKFVFKRSFYEPLAATLVDGAQCSRKVISDEP
jgi:hypothetical protein